MTAKIGSLFSGYGGLDMGIQSVIDSEVAWVSDIDKGANALLAHHHPTLPNLGDISTVNWSEVEPVDILTGGFPCQDLSTAGKRAGLSGARSGLWSEMANAIDHLRPQLVVAENVRGILSAKSQHSEEVVTVGPRGGRKVGYTDRALGVVLSDLADLGYDAQWYGLRAADVGAAHGRFRVFLFATPANAGGSGGLEAVEHDGRGSQVRDGAGVPHQSDRDVVRPGPERDAGFGVARAATPADADPTGAARLGEYCGGAAAKASGVRVGVDHDVRPGHGRVGDLTLLPTPQTAYTGTSVEAWRERRPAGNGATRETVGDLRLVTEEMPDRWGDYAAAIARWEHVIGRPAPDPTETGAKGKPRLSPRFVEWLMGLPADHVTSEDIGITRNEQLKALGNGVVPQQAAAATRALLWDIQ